MSTSWDQVRNTFLDALERPRGERSAFLDAACRHDAELRAEVESLLAAEAESTELSRLDVAGIRTDRATDGAAFVPRAGMHLGRFLLRREIASGGMGTVFEAEQSEPRRIVALKTMRVGLSRDARTRFRYEAETLARLQHANIAQIFEAGIHEEPSVDGGVRADCPYFAMEFIAGARPLSSFARERDLSIEQRLRLFLAVVDAVHYGHQRGVIHRDLKPGNILVDERGNPKVIDYGIARLAGFDSERSVRTLAGEVVGTLLYMSPEQLRGDRDAVDVRSDVYSLGAVMHELLAGAPPFDLRDKTVVEAISILTTTEPRPPSAIDPRVPRELDWIVQRALAREPERRYRSAFDLGADVTRFLAHEPVEAGPPSTLYRVRKFARRHRMAFAAGLSILLALAVGLVVAIDAKREAESARDVATENAARANATLAFVKSIFEAARADTGTREARVKDLLDAAEARIDGELIGQPLVEATVRWMIGDCYLTIDEYAAAARQIEKAVLLRRQLLGDDHLDTLRSRIGLANVRHRQGRTLDAEAEYRAAAEGLVARAGPDDTDAVVAVSGHATTLERLGRFAEAEAEYRRALELAEQRCNGSDQHAMIESMYVSVLVLTGKRVEALEMSRRALERTKKSAGGNEEIRLRVALIAAVRIAQDDPATGAAELEVILADATRAFGPRHGTTIQAQLHRGLALLSLGDSENATALVRDAVARVREADGDEAWTTATTRREFAKLLEQTGEFDEEETLLTTAIADATRGLGEADPEAIALRQAFVHFLVARGRIAEAEEEQRPLLESCRQTQGAAGPATVEATLTLNGIFEATGRHAEAAELLRPFVDVCRAELGPDHQMTITAVANLGASLFLSHEYAEAVPALEAGLAGYEQLVGPTHPAFAAIAQDLGIAKREAGDLEGSEAALLRCIESREAALDDAGVSAAQAELAKTRERRTPR